MEYFIGLILIGLTTHYGSADVSHLSKHNHNGYLPPQPAYNSPIDQDYNGINSQSHDGVGKAQAQSGYDNEINGYLPPYQEHSQRQNHIHQHQEERGYLPPLKEQDPFQSHNDQHDHQEENRGYLPPHQGQSHIQENIGHHQEEQRGYLPPHQGQSNIQENIGHHQEEQRGYLPPHQGQSNIQENNNHHQEDQRGYLPPYQGQSHIQKNIGHHQEEQRGYLPPNQEQVQDHDHHHIHQPHNTRQEHNQIGGFDPNVEISYNNDYAISRQHDHNNHQINTEHSKGINSNEQFEDNSNGYNYSPPNQGFEEGRQQQVQQQINFNGNQQTHANFVPPSQDSASPYQKDLQSNHEPQVQSNFKQNLDYLPPNDVKPEHQNEQHQQQVNRDSLPPSALSQVQTQTHFYRAQKQEEAPPSFQNQPFEQSLQKSERDYLPPIGALELPQSSDTLHIVPPSQLGLPIEQSNKEPQTRGHINVPLPVPQVGYYFIPGVVTKIPSLMEANPEQFRPAINIPAITSEQQLQTNQISPAEYSRPSNSEIRIIPSIQTSQDIASQGYLTPNQIVSQHEHQHFADINYSSPQSNHLEGGQQFFPPLSQTQPDYFFDQKLEQNQNKVQNTHQHEDHSQSSFQNFAISAVHGVSNQQNQISKPLDSGNNKANAYLPPINEFQQQQAFEHQDQQVYNNINLPQPENYNQVTNLQTYMNSVNSNDRYGSLQFQPQPAVQFNPPPIIPPPMFSKPSAIRAYAPGMAYKVETNVPFSSFSQAGYLPPVSSSRSGESQQEYSSSIGFELNEEAKKTLAQQSQLQDNTVFPVTDMLGTQDDEMSQIMEQLGDHIRSIQITNHHDNPIGNNKALDSSVRKIEILGQCHENPMGNHKVINVISKVPNPQGVHQTIKIFTDSTEVALPKNNNYLPPYPTTINTNIRKLRQTGRRSH